MVERIMHGYKVKLYPNKTQQKRLVETMGACRFVYNHFLAEKQRLYKEQGKNLTLSEMSKRLTILRRETDWLAEIQIRPLQQSLRALNVAYGKFFRKEAGFPAFKKKRGKNSFRKIYGWVIDGKKITIERGLSVSFRGRFPEKAWGTLTISRDGTGNFWASCSVPVARKESKLKKSVIGLDFGIETLVATSDGEKYKNLRSLEKTLGQIKSASRSLSKKQKGSVRREKARLKLARLYQKLRNRRDNYLHHVSKAIVDKNHVIIAAEDLNTAGMMKNRKLSRAIGDASWSELTRQLTYKQVWRGGRVVKVGRYFPSSKTCSKCSFVVDTLPLQIRSWKCEKCGTEHDRDINAAKNVQQAAVLLGVEGGEGRHKAEITHSLKRGQAN